jgi:hypothetical protein
MNAQEALDDVELGIQLYQTLTQKKKYFLDFATDQGLFSLKLRSIPKGDQKKRKLLCDLDDCSEVMGYRLSYMEDVDDPKKEFIKWFEKVGPSCSLMTSLYHYIQNGAIQLPDNIKNQDMTFINTAALGWCDVEEPTKEELYDPFAFMVGYFIKRYFLIQSIVKPLKRQDNYIWKVGNPTREANQPLDQYIKSLFVFHDLPFEPLLAETIMKNPKMYC